MVLMQLEIRMDIKLLYTGLCIRRTPSARSMCRGSHSSVQGGHAVWTLVSATCFLHLAVPPLSGAYAVRSDSLRALILTLARSRVTSPNYLGHASCCRFCAGGAILLCFCNVYIVFHVVL